jgi:hypothetical protein
MTLLYQAVGFMGQATARTSLEQAAGVALMGCAQVLGDDLLEYG